jgi:hypothetical protein
VTKTIDTLAKDIEGLFGEAQLGNSHTFEEDVLAKFGSSIALHMSDALKARSWKRPPNTLRMSEIGKPCHRQIWYSVHTPELAEKMLSHTLFKFVYGNIIEEATLLLAEAAGHKVEDRQRRVGMVIDGVSIIGHLDARIDGVLVDVKSCSSYSYKKFQEGLNDSNDSFGYRYQLESYRLNTGDKESGFLAVDKQNGHVGYFPQTPPTKGEFGTKVINLVRDIKSHVPPMRRFPLVPHDKSGNMKLGIECSYCPFKRECWKDANGGYGLRLFAYSYGPVFLGTVTREPKVPEIDLNKEVDSATLSEIPSATDTVT